MKYLASIEESIRDILATPLGSRVMLPEYGSNLHTLVDKKIDSHFKSKLTQFVIKAVSRWENRVKIVKVEPQIEDSKLRVILSLDSGEKITI